MSVRKVLLQEFQHQIKDVRSQLLEQVKCLETRTDVQTAILHEINDFLKKRAEIDLEYSKQLDKLVKSVMLKYKNERQKRMNWTLYSTCNLWQQLVDDTKEEAKQRGITAEVYVNHIAASISTRCSSLQKISKKCREIGVLAQGEIIRVLNELQTAMKTYQICYAEFNVVNIKLQQAESERNKLQESTNFARKQKSFQKHFNKKYEKFEASRLKCNRARNEYLLCIDAANAALHKFFADDLSDLIDCTDLGMEYWLNLILSNVISARKAACQTEMNSLANLGSFKDSLQPQLDKQKFFESNSSIFMLPKRFDFKCDSSETINTISLCEGLSDELKQRHHQIRKRLITLRSESDESWRTLEETNQRIKSILSMSTLVEITEHGIADHRPPAEGLENDLAKSYEFYLQNFSFYLFNQNLIMRLEARADGIGNALLNSNVLLNETFSEDGGGSGGQKRELSEDLIGCDHDWHEQSRRKKRLGSQASAATGDSSGGGVSNVGGSAINNSTNCQSSPRRRRPRLFGGSLEEYVEITNERIPLIVTSCIRVLSQFALHHQGVFRVSGSQVEINHMKEAFENGENPLRDVQDASDVNSIAGVLKLYFRELREPLFPFYLFELLTDCAKCNSTSEFISQILPLLNKLPRSTYLLLRYLFAFLNHLSEFSDENMMDPYNLAICFGPTLLPIPEGKDQVYYQNYVNEVVKNLIVHHDLIFTAKVVGPRYQKYDVISATNPNENNNEIELFVDDSEEYFGSTGGAGVAQLSLAQNGTINSTDFFDYRNYSEELLNNPYRVHNYHLSSDSAANQPLQYLSGPGSLLMNSSIYSTNSNATNFLGMSQYSDCVPPSITATLVKSSANVAGNTKTEPNLNNTDIQKSVNNISSKSPLNFENGAGKKKRNFDKKDNAPRLIKNGIIEPECVMEEEDLDAFSCQLKIQPSSQHNNQLFHSKKPEQRVQLKQLSFVPLDDQQQPQQQKQQAEPFLKSYTHLSSPVRKVVRNNADAVTSTGLVDESMELSHQSLRDTLVLSRTNSASRNSNNSNRSNSSGGCVHGYSTETMSLMRSQTREFNRHQNVNNLPPSPTSHLKNGNNSNYIKTTTTTEATSQLPTLKKVERIRIPVTPDPLIYSQKSYNAGHKNSTGIPPSYDVLYGGAKSNDEESKKNSPTANALSCSTIVNSGNRSDSMGACGGNSSRSSSSMSAAISRNSSTIQQPQNFLATNKNCRETQKLFTNAAILNSLHDTSPTRRLNNDLTNVATIQRLQRQKSDLTAGSLPPTGFHQIKPRTDTSPTKQPIVVVNPDALDVTPK